MFYHWNNFWKFTRRVLYCSKNSPSSWITYFCWVSRFDSWIEFSDICLGSILCVLPGVCPAGGSGQTWTSLTSWRRPQSCRWPSAWASAPDVWRIQAQASGGPSQTSAERPASRTDLQRWPTHYCRDDNGDSKQPKITNKNDALPPGHSGSLTMKHCCLEWRTDGKTGRGAGLKCGRAAELHVKFIYIYLFYFISANCICFLLLFFFFYNQTLYS